MILITCSVILISLLASLLNEIISYIFLYRHQHYTNLITRLNDCAKSSEKVVSAKQEKMLKESFDKINESLKMVRFKSTVIAGITFAGLIAFFNRLFAAKVVATLPFLPYFIIRRLSHRSLEGDDYYECSFIFLYIVCSSAIKPILSKFLGFTESRLAYKISQDRSKLF